MANKIDWSLDDTILRKKLLRLSKSQLIKICKSKKVSITGNKKEMIDQLIAKNSNQINIKPHIIKKINSKRKVKKINGMVSECIVKVKENGAGNVGKNKENEGGKEGRL